jgi:hypothetical protein
MGGSRTTGHAARNYQKSLQSLEVMLTDGWVKGRLNRKKPRLQITTPSPEEGEIVHIHDLSEERPGDAERS